MNEQKEKMQTADCWKYIAMFFMGMVVGFLISPIKQGISMFNNNDFKVNKNCEDKESEE